MLDLMFLGSRAPWGRSEDRCDGDGSEADGAKPPVKPGPMLPVLGVLVFPNTSALVIPPSSGLRINQARRWPGRSCPAYRISFALRIAGGAIASRAVFFRTGQTKVLHPLALGARRGGLPVWVHFGTRYFGTRLALGNGNVALAETHRQ